LIALTAVATRLGLSVLLAATAFGEPGVNLAAFPLSAVRLYFAAVEVLAVIDVCGSDGSTSRAFATAVLVWLVAFHSTLSRN
jgi:hypothetical protein